MAMEQQPPPAAKFEDENSYSYVTGVECRKSIHTGTDPLLATVLLAWSFREPRLFKAWLVSTTEHFLSLPMWKTRYFSQKEHGTQWATRLLSAAFAALTVVTGVTVGVLNGRFAAYSAGTMACASWYVHGARMRQLGLVGEADDKKWTEKGAVLQKLDFHWKVVNGHETTTKQPFTTATLTILAYNLVLGTTSLYLVLGNTGAVIVWANCLWGFLSLWLLIHGGLLTGAFDKICEVAFSKEFDGLMTAAVEGYEKVDAVDKAIDLCVPLVAAKERGDEVTPVMIDDLRGKVIALLGPQGHQVLPESLKTAGRIAGRLNLLRRGAFTSYEEARCAVVCYLTGNEDGRIVFRDPPTGRLADIAVCYKGKRADDAKDKELGGIGHQWTEKMKFLRRYLGKRSAGGGTYTRKGGLKDKQKIVIVVQTNACTEEGYKEGESTCSTDQTGPSGLIKIELGRDAELLTSRYLKGRPAMRSQLAGVYAFTRFMMWKKFGEEPTDADALDDLDINTVGTQRYVADFFREPQAWYVASTKSQGLAMGIGTRFWYKCPGDKTWTLVGRGDDSKYWQTFATPTDADLDAAVPYEKLTINGASDGPLFAPIWEERLDDDDEHDDGTWEESRDALRATRIAAALAAVAAWNLEKQGPAPVFSIALDDGSGDRRCARVAFSSELAPNGKKRTDDTDEYGPMADEVAKAGGICVSVKDYGLGEPDVVLVGRGVKLKQDGAHMTMLKLDACVVYVNWKHGEYGAESHPGTPGSLVGRNLAPATGSIAQGRPRRGAAPAAATPAAPTESAAELAEAPCFVLDALKAGGAVLDDDAKRFREHYACYKRNPTDPADMRLITVEGQMTDKTAHQYFGEFYPTGGHGKWHPGFLPKDPPRASYP